MKNGSTYLSLSILGLRLIQVHERGPIFQWHVKQIKTIFIQETITFHDNVIKWKHFPRYCPLCEEYIGHRWITLTKASDSDVLCDRRLNKRLSKHSICRWFETLSCSLWRHCNAWKRRRQNDWIFVPVSTFIEICGKFSNYDVGIRKNMLVNDIPSP